MYYGVTDAVHASDDVVLSLLKVRCSMLFVGDDNLLDYVVAFVEHLKQGHFS